MLEFIKDNKDFLDLIISASGFIGVILTIIFSFKSQTNAINNQWGLDYYKQQMNFYLKVSEVTSMITYLKESNPDSELLRKNILDFHTLYGGPMLVLESTDVEHAMNFYKKGLDNDININSLKSLTFYLSQTLRNDSKDIYLAEGADSSSGNNNELINKMKEIVEDKKNYL